MYPMGPNMLLSQPPFVHAPGRWFFKNQSMEQGTREFDDSKQIQN